MNGSDAISIIRRLGLSQAKAGHLVGVSATSVTKWANGGPVSKPVARLLRLLDARPELVAVLDELAAEKPAKRK